jgi:hypothetical protein
MAGMKTEPTDTATDNPTDTGRGHRLARVALIAPACVVGTASFFESFHGLYDLLRRVAQAPPALAAVGPIGVDGLQLVSLVGTVIARRAPWHTRLYMWTALLGATGVSVAGNAIDARARGLADAGVWISGAWPVLLAAASHIVVVSSRLLENRTSPPDDEPTRVPRVEEVYEHHDEEQPDIVGEREQPAVPTDAQLRARARARYSRGVSCAKISTDLRAQGHDVSEKKVERWTADLRAARKTAPTDAEPAMEPAT